MGNSTPESKSAEAATSALADFAFLATAVAGAKAARIELLDGTSGEHGDSSNEAPVSSPILIADNLVGALHLIAPTATAETLAPLLRRLAHHLEREESLALAEHANGIAASAARRFEALFDGVPVACYSTDADGRLMEWNAAAEARWPLTAAWGEDVSELVRPEDPDAQRSLLARALKGESVQEANATAFPLRDAAGAVVGAIVTAS